MTSPPLPFAHDQRLVICANFKYLYLNFLKKNMSRLNLQMHSFLKPNILEELFKHKIYTVSDFLNNDIQNICKIINLSHRDTLQIRKHLINKNSAFRQNGLNYYNELIKKSALLLTKIPNLDTLLKGGLMSGNIYEICGLPSSGKTKFCLTLTKNVAETLNQPVYYIDTRNSFSGKKLMTLWDTQTSEKQIGEIMSKILVKQINTYYELVTSLYEIKDELNNDLNLRLIVINSLPTLFYQSSDYNQNCAMLNHLTNIMQLLAREYHIAFVVVNIITTWYESEDSSSEIVGLGKYWKDVPHTRIMIKKTDTTMEYQCSIMNSTKLQKESTCLITLL